MAPNPPWKDLPQELVTHISSFLVPYPLDLLHFRSVCKSWHSSSLSSPSPLKPPIPPRTHCIFPTDFCTLSVTTVFSLRDPGSNPSTPRTCVLFIDELNPGAYTLRRRFTRWDFGLPLDFPRKLNLHGFHATQLGRFHNLTYGYDRLGKVVKRGVWSDGCDKVVNFSNRSGFVALFEGGAELGLFKLGDQEWEVVVHDGGSGVRINDIVDYKGRILGVDGEGRVYEMGYHSSQLNAVGGTGRGVGGGGRRKRLVESLGLLYLVVRGMELEEVKFKVYVLNERDMTWVEVGDIGDRIFFFGDEFGFSASVEDLGGSFKKNCIVFSYYSFQGCEGGGGDGDSYLFRKSRPRAFCVGVYHFDDGPCLRPLDAYPRYLNVLWPAPTWLWQDKKSTLFGIFEAALYGLLKIRDENSKAEFKDVCLVMKIFIGCKISPQEVHDVQKQVGRLYSFLNDMIAYIENELTSIRRDIEFDSVSRRADSQATELPNQEEPKDGNGSVSVHLKATEQAESEDEWLSNDMRRRLEAHVELKVMLERIGRVLKENTNNFHDLMKLKEQVSASAAD